MKLKEYIKTNLLNEGLKSVEISKAVNDLSDILLEKGIYKYGIFEHLKNDTESWIGCCLSDKENHGAIILWKTGNILVIDSIAFVSDILSTRKMWYNGNCANAEIILNIPGKTLENACDIVEKVFELLNSGMALDMKLFQNLSLGGENIEDLEKQKKTIYSKIKYANRMRYPSDDGLMQEYTTIREKINKSKEGILENVSLCSILDKCVLDKQEWFERQLSGSYEDRIIKSMHEIIDDLQGENSVSVLIGARKQAHRFLSALKKAGLEYGLFRGVPNISNLYRNLADNRAPSQILVYTDCDPLLKEPLSLVFNGTSVEYNRSIPVKEPQENDKDFYITNDSGALNYPKSFEYNGKRLIISELNPEEIDNSHIGGAKIHNLKETRDERLELIIAIMHSVCSDEISEDIKHLIIKSIKELLNNNTSINLDIKTFVGACSEYVSNLPQEIALERSDYMLKN